MATKGTPYVKDQSWTEGKVIVQTVGDSSAQVSPEAAFTAVADASAAIPAIMKAQDLELQGSLDFAKSYLISGLRSINSGIFSAKGFGATGDGVTDDRTAIIAAIDAAIAAGGGIIYFEPTANYYFLGDEIDFDNDVSGTGANLVFMGAGRASNIQIESAGNHACFNVAGNANIQFHNMYLTADSTQTDGTLISNLGNYCGIESCWFDSSSTSMEGAISTAAATNVGVRINNIDVTGSYSDTNVITCQGMRGGSLTNVYMNVSGGTPLSMIYMEAANMNEGLNISGLRINMAAGTAANACIEFDASHTGTVNISDFELITSVDETMGIFIGANSTYASFSNGKIFTNTNHANSRGIKALTTTDCAFNNVAIIGNGASAAGTGLESGGSTRMRLIGATITGWGAGASGGRANDAVAVVDSVAAGCIVKGNDTNTMHADWTFESSAVGAGEGANIDGA